MRLILTFSVWFCFLVSNVVAQEAPDVLAPGELLTAMFRQERHLQGFDGAAQSSGQFYLVPGKGVLWATQKPFENKLIVGRRGITQMVNGKKTLRIPARKMPGASVLQSVFESIMQDDWTTLEHKFGVKRKFIGDHWTLNFKPSSSASGPGIQRISLTGKTYVETIKIVRDNGDWDHIFLTNHSIRDIAQMGSVVRVFE